MQFEKIYADHVDMVYNLCMNYLRNIQEAEEATQDVFVKVHKKLHKFEQKSALKTWIYKIAINTCLDRIKSLSRKNKIKSFFRIPVVPKDFNHPGVQLENKEALEGLFSKIDMLPTNQKTALLLKSVERLSQKEIAEVMDLSTKAVESLLSRAKKNLKTKLSEG